VKVDIDVVLEKIVDSCLFVVVAGGKKDLIVDSNHLPLSSHNNKTCNMSGGTITNNFVQNSSYQWASQDLVHIQQHNGDKVPGYSSGEK
jgi:hypothetical protein